ncbi:MAG: HPr family phosphocarrier protein [Anaerolineales bacterium]|nr:HPr family phosphocarrier protein [Anaerolineales bacterium]
MKSVELKIDNAVGLHARPATLFVQAAQEHAAEITVVFEGKTVNAKSLLALLALGAGKGSVITVAADGDDEDAALQALSDLVAGNFGE